MKNRVKYTQSEILSQPQVWKQTLEEFSKFRTGDVPNFADIEHLLVTGCGSTYYLSIWAARLIQKDLGLLASPVPASEIWLSPGAWIKKTRSTQLLAISRSGSTSETLAAVKEIKAWTDFPTLAVTCYPASGLAELVDKLVTVTAAQEKSIAQTRSFTNMMLAVAFLIDRMVSSDMPDLIQLRGNDLINHYQSQIQDLARNPEIERFFFLGSGSLYGLACEAMLKMKEMSLSYSEAYHFLEFRHGPMSMVNKNSLVVGLLGTESRAQELSVLEDMKKLGARILALDSSGDTTSYPWIDHAVELDLSYLGSYGAVLYLPLLQLLSLEKSLSNNLDPDNPKNLDAVVVLDV